VKVPYQHFEKLKARVAEIRAAATIDSHES
jgi:hypothetical protein